MDDDLMIERYLDGAMSQKELAEFKAELKTRPELQRLVDAERVVRKAVHRAALHATAHVSSIPSPMLVASLKRSHIRPSPFTFARLGMSVAVLGVAAFILTTRKTNEPSTAPMKPAPIVRSADSVPATPLVAPSFAPSQQATAPASVPSADSHLPGVHPRQVIRANSETHPKPHRIHDLDEHLNRPPIYTKDSIRARLHAN